MLLRPTGAEQPFQDCLVPFRVPHNPSFRNLIYIAAGGSSCPSRTVFVPLQGASQSVFLNSTYIVSPPSYVCRPARSSYPGGDKPAHLLIQPVKLVCAAPLAADCCQEFSGPN